MNMFTAIHASISRRAALAALAMASALALLMPFAGHAGAEAASSGFVYTADEYGNSVSRIDLASGRVEIVPVTVTPHNVQFVPGTGRVLAVGSPLQVGAGHGHAEAEDSHGSTSQGGGYGGSEAGGALIVLDPLLGVRHLEFRPQERDPPLDMLGRHHLPHHAVLHPRPVGHHAPHHPGVAAHHLLHHLHHVAAHHAARHLGSPRCGSGRVGSRFTRTLWEAVAAALRENARGSTGMMQQEQDAQGLPNSLERREKLLSARLDAVRQLRAAVEPFYASLDEVQKAAADNLLMPMGMM